MNLAPVIAALCREPFGLTPAEAGRLTLRQIALLLQPGDGAAADNDAPPKSPREWFWDWGRANRLKDYQIEQLWQKHQAASAGKE